MAKLVRPLFWCAVLTGSMVAFLVPSAAQQVSRVAPTCTAAPVAPHRSRGEPGHRRRRRAGRPARLLRGRRVGRHLQDHRRRLKWEPIFDDQPVSSIGASPSRLPIPMSSGPAPASHSSAATSRSARDLQVHRRRQDLDADGPGEDRPDRPRLVIDPTNPEYRVRVRARPRLRPATRARCVPHDRRRQDVGAVLFVDENTGCSDIAMDPKNPRILFAGMWQLEINTWGRESGGPGSGLFSRATAARRGSGSRATACRRAPVGKVAVAIAPSNPNRIYALIETGDGVPWNGQGDRARQIWRSDDGGETWRMISYDRSDGAHALLLAHGRRARQRERDVLPDGGVPASRSTAGETLVQQPGTRAPGGDHHDMWIDPDQRQPDDRRLTTRASRSPSTAGAPGTACVCRSRRCTT